MATDNIDLLIEHIDDLRKLFRIEEDKKTGISYLLNTVTYKKAKMVKPHGVVVIDGCKPINYKTVRKDTLAYMITYGKHPSRDVKNVRLAHMATVHRWFKEEAPHKQTNAGRIAIHDQQIKDLQQQVKELKKALQEMQTKGW
jgi:hypothetical protein